MKKLFQALKLKVSALQVAFAAMFAMFSLGANAALPAWAAGIGADLSEAVTDAATMVGPVVALSIATVIIFKLIKRFSNKV